MRNLLVINMIKSEGFKLIVEKITAQFNFTVEENSNNIQQADLIFVDAQSLMKLGKMREKLNLIGVTISPKDVIIFYQHDIFEIIPEDVTEKQLELVFKNKITLKGVDILETSFLNNSSFDFSDVIYYIDSIFMNSILGVAFLTKDLNTLIFNPRFSAFFHNIYNETPILGKHLFNEMSKKDRNFWEEAILNCASLDDDYAELAGNWDDKSKHYRLKINQVFKLTKVIGYSVVIRDVSQFVNANADLKRYQKYLVDQNSRLEKAYKDLEFNNDKLKIAYEKVNALSKHDYLTQAPNRKFFLEKIEYEQLRFQRTKSPFIVAYGDIDDFKLVNDNYGHETGDYILISLANLIKGTLRKIDFFCRWGGEEFVIFIAESNLETGKNIMNRLLQEIRNYNFNYNGKMINITMTFGLAIYDEDQHINKIIDLADKKLYWGKKHNKNQVVDIMFDK